MEPRIKVGKPGSSVPDRSEMNILEQKLDFSCLASSFEFILTILNILHFFVRSLSMAPIRSIGSGKTMVLLLSEAISVSVCR